MKITPASIHALAVVAFALGALAWSESSRAEEPYEMEGCIIVPFHDMKTENMVLLDAASLQDIIKTCDRFIGMADHQSSKYAGYRFGDRGLARYFLLRGEHQPLGNNLLQAARPGTMELAQPASADLQRFIDMGPPPNMFNHNISQAKANLYLGELSAIIAAHDKRDDGYDRALAQLALAESTAKQVGDSATAEAAVASRTVVADFRAGRITTMQAVASNDPGKRYGSFAEAVSAVAGGSAAPVAPAAEDTGARFRRFSAVYAQRENDYKPKVVALQEALKAQQPGADSAQACQALATMDASYQAMKAAFVPMRQMKDQGELANQPDLVQKLEARDAQQNKVQASIDGTRTRLGCK